MSTEKILYGIAVALVVAIFSFTTATASEDKNSQFLKDVIETFTHKCKGKQDIAYLNCWAKYTPEKCKNLVYGTDRVAWKRCVYSCGSASLYSKKIGECSD